MTSTLNLTIPKTMIKSINGVLNSFNWYTVEYCSNLLLQCINVVQLILVSPVFYILPKKIIQIRLFRKSRGSFKRTLVDSTIRINFIKTSAYINIKMWRGTILLKQILSYYISGSTAFGKIPSKDRTKLIDQKSQCRLAVRFFSEQYVPEFHCFHFILLFKTLGICFIHHVSIFLRPKSIILFINNVI